ncbi:MAG TPA: hypothetical protein VNA20_04580 [Frankiaceae bacterium]|nr:hypothetical protein [Frankiaceae bacterium]
MTGVAIGGVRVTGAARAVAGRTASVPVEVTNGAGAGAEVVVRAVGLDPAWACRPVRCGPLAASEVAAVRLAVTLPQWAPAGEFPFVVATAGLPDGAATEADALLVVECEPGLRVALEPRVPRGVRRARFAIAVENPARHDVVATITADGVRGLRLRHRVREVTVAPGARVRVRARARVTGRLGGGERRLPFAVTADGGAGPARADGVFVAEPWTATLLARAALVLVIVGVWLGVTLLVVGIVADRAHRPAKGLVPSAGDE